MSESRRIPCPRNWITPFQPLPNETLQENYRRIFQEYLPEMKVLNVIPRNFRNKPRCNWSVLFSRDKPPERGLFQIIRAFLNEWKPGNVGVGRVDIIRLTAQTRRPLFEVIYNVECNCEAMEVCDDDEDNLADVSGQVQEMKLEEM
ncbi:hypothetical protein Zmor_013544 [Zophobas morio]|uniref:Uncharacterized protein n=1 Tax=Zophobas morio TaxID=2755281 RepID=A0AA38MFM8_9CUCU|nr:hypothetical protein Zmor_013544 [Zophobas morio]